MMNCPKCGTNFPNDARFCSTCGSNVSHLAPTLVQDFTTSVSNSSGNNSSGDYQAVKPSARPISSGIRIDSGGRGEGRGYSYEILYRGAFAIAVIKLRADQSINAEAGAMVSMSGNIELQAQTNGGLIGALNRAVGGETAFVYTFSARGAEGEVNLAPASLGEITAIEMSNQAFYLQSSSYLGGDTSLAIESKWSAKTFFGGEGLFVLNVQGSGTLLISSFGSIHQKRLNYGERYILDPGHLVAWEAHMQYQLRKAASAGWFRNQAGGEGYIAEFTGPGEILIQTRKQAALAGMLKSFFSPKTTGGGLI